MARPESPADRAADRRWPIAIAVGLLLVILVNLAFIYVAVSGRDEIVPSYTAEHR